MPATLDVESTLMYRYQTTVLETVRRAMRLGECDKVRYAIRPSDDVVMIRADASDGDDPEPGQFLNVLTRDMGSHLERLPVGNYLKKQSRL